MQIFITELPLTDKVNHKLSSLLIPMFLLWLADYNMIQVVKLKLCVIQKNANSRLFDENDFGILISDKTIDIQGSDGVALLDDVPGGHS